MKDQFYCDEYQSEYFTSKKILHISINNDQGDYTDRFYQERGIPDCDLGDLVTLSKKKVVFEFLKSFFLKASFKEFFSSHFILGAS